MSNSNATVMSLYAETCLDLLNLRADMLSSPQQRYVRYLVSNSSSAEEFLWILTAHCICIQRKGVPKKRIYFHNHVVLKTNKSIKILQIDFLATLILCMWCMWQDNKHIPWCQATLKDQNHILNSQILTLMVVWYPCLLPASSWLLVLRLPNYTASQSRR